MKSGRHAAAEFERAHATKAEKPAPDWVPLAEDGSAIIKRKIPPPVELVAGLVTECSKFAVGGSSKTFKTWLILNAGLAIATGTPFLGRATLQRKVLFVNFELRESTFGRRLQAVAEALRLDLKAGAFFHLPLRGRLGGTVSLPPSAIVNRLLATARALGSQVVVIDPLYKLAAGGEENHAGEVTLLFNELDRLTVEGGRTVLFADHAGKGNQSEKDPLDVFRGSSAKGADVDGAFVMRRHAVPNAFSVDVILRELPPVEPFVVAWEFPTFRVRADLDAADMKKAKGGRPATCDPKVLLSAILNTDAEHGVSLSEWASRAEVARSTLRGYTNEFRAQGWIATVKEGNQARQYLTASGQKYAKA